MRQQIQKMIQNYVKIYQIENNIETKWREPIVKFADAKDEMFKELKKAVSEDHLMPENLLKGAESIVAFFIPFEKPIPETNIKGRYSSHEWAAAYIETNTLIGNINELIEKYLKEKGYQSALVPATHNFSKETLMSQWSHRHVAYIAGMGTFGINNMLITDAGCCGRIGTLVTDLKIKADDKIERENCLYKHNGTCGVCVGKCQFGALTFDGYTRRKCYGICMENDEYHKNMGLTDICGKCLVGLPCSYINPVKGN
ncbi:MAG: epoxyqueuosine reductase [Bacillota bacterium]|nr:epoxyqueuosine reductase [Bacillota bacterium]